MKHTTEHELAGKTVPLALSGETHTGIATGDSFAVEDWADRVFGTGWMLASNMAAVNYAMRAVPAGLPLNDEVVYGKVGHLGHLVHVTELGEVAS